MLQKLKDGASKLKAKIGGDQLDEKLAEVVSEQNWQASTQQLHEVANAAYNYEKWQRISEFIWEKLKKSKSWRKILKTFNLIQFLLKNGPPSIISNFKYDVYQLRTFQSYSNYVDGVDKGETIRERAKAVVGLLSNEEQLEEERVKAKAIREKMANVVGGTTYGSSGSSGNYGGSYGGSYGGNDSYGYGSKPQKEKKKSQSNSYNYGTTTGHFGDYTYNKSTLDKYKDASKNEKTTTQNETKKEERKNDITVETKKPFERVANKLSKPGQKREDTKQSPVKPIPQGNDQIIDLFGSDPTPPPQQSNPTFQLMPEPSKPQQVIQPTQQPQPPVQQPVIQQPQQYFQPQQPPQQYQQSPYQQPPQPSYQPNQFPYQQPYQPPFGQPPQPVYNNQFGGIPNQYPGFNQPNQFGYPPQPQPAIGQPNPYNTPQYQIPAQNAYNAYGNQAYSANGLTAPNGNIGITLSTNKPAQNSGSLTYSGSGTAENVKWLSNTEKGLIDFSDFGAQIKKEKQVAADSKGQAANLQMDNWW